MRSDQGISQLARDTAADLSRLVRLEAQLAAEQIKGQVGKKLIAAGAGGAGALLLVFGLLFALAGAAAAIAIVLPVWAALLVVAGGAVLALERARPEHFRAIGAALGRNEDAARNAGQPRPGETPCHS
jgi:VIT1/CCC1 family predicted Fe2+/Mn2+ transporter